MEGQTTPLDPALARRLGLAGRSAVLVVAVEADSPGAHAGLVAGDLIVDFDGQPVAGIDALHKLLTEARVGTRVPLVVVRRGESRIFPVVPAESRPPQR